MNSPAIMAIKKLFCSADGFRLGVPACVERKTECYIRLSWPMTPAPLIAVLKERDIHDHQEGGKQKAIGCFWTFPLHRK
jgi:hypothetical protein